MRIAFGEFAHETNAFRPGVTDVAQFKALMWERGDDILAAHRGIHELACATAEAAAVQPVAHDFSPVCHIVRCTGSFLALDF